MLGDASISNPVPKDRKKKASLEAGRRKRRKEEEAVGE
jgi:hypothetical protein